LSFNCKFIESKHENSYGSYLLLRVHYIILVSHCQVFHGAFEFTYITDNEQLILELYVRQKPVIPCLSRQQLAERWMAQAKDYIELRVESTRDSDQLDENLRIQLRASTGPHSSASFK
jgi:hypothetical protein